MLFLVPSSLKMNLFVNTVSGIVCAYALFYVVYNIKKATI